MSQLRLALVLRPAPSRDLAGWFWWEPPPSSILRIVRATTLPILFSGPQLKSYRYSVLVPCIATERIPRFNTVPCCRDTSDTHVIVWWLASKSAAKCNVQREVRRESSVRELTVMYWWYLSVGWPVLHYRYRHDLLSLVITNPTIHGFMLAAAGFPSGWGSPVW